MTELVTFLTEHFLWYNVFLEFQQHHYAFQYDWFSTCWVPYFHGIMCVFNAEWSKRSNKYVDCLDFFNHWTQAQVPRCYQVTCFVTLTDKWDTGLVGSPDCNFSKVTWKYSSIRVTKKVEQCAKSPRDCQCFVIWVFSSYSAEDYAIWVPSSILTSGFYCKTSQGIMTCCSHGSSQRLSQHSREVATVWSCCSIDISWQLLEPF